MKIETTIAEKLMLTIGEDYNEALETAIDMAVDEKFDLNTGRMQFYFADGSRLWFDDRIGQYNTF